MDLIVILAMLLIGYFVGGSIEKKHFAKLVIEEEGLAHIPYSNLKKLPKGTEGQVILLHGSVVVAQDYFKSVMGAIINIFGGRIHAFETLLDRARREAIIRVKKQAKEHGVNAIYNLRLETSSISKGSGNKQVGAIEVLAYATGIKGAPKKRTPVLKAEVVS